MTFPAMMALALAIDAVLGWPDRLYARIGHPVTWIGRLISAIETRWNRGGPMQRRTTGALCVLVVTAAAAVPAWAVQSLLPSGPVGRDPRRDPRLAARRRPVAPRPRRGGGAAPRAGDLGRARVPPSR